MTSFLAWVGVDQRGPASLYFAADSRISWDATSSWDRGRKVFASSRLPLLFGYVGDVLFPSIVLGQVITLADAALILSPTSTAPEAFEAVASIVKQSFESVPPAQRRAFTIVIGLREGMLMQSSFYVFALSWNATAGWSDRVVQFPMHSAPLTILGSGETIVSQWHGYWDSSSQGGTSRAIFSAFCDALRAKSDPRTGGAPQLVGMYRRDEAKTFGVIYQETPYVHGVPIVQAPSSTPENIEWRNELFERCDVTGQRLEDAQVHHAPHGLGPRRP